MAQKSLLLVSALESGHGWDLFQWPFPFRFYKANSFCIFYEEDESIASIPGRLAGAVDRL